MRLYLATFIMVDSKIKPEICPEDNVKLFGIFEKEATAIEVIVEDILQDRIVKKAEDNWGNISEEERNRREKNRALKALGPKY